jgi:hypothetical protein
VKKYVGRTLGKHFQKAVEAGLEEAGTEATLWGYHGQMRTILIVEITLLEPASEEGEVLSLPPCSYEA